MEEFMIEITKMIKFVCTGGMKESIVGNHCIVMDLFIASPVPQAFPNCVGSTSQQL